MSSPSCDTTSNHLILAARDGDRDSYGRLVERYAGMVSSLSFAIVREPEISREITQEVFLAGWRGLGRLREPEAFLPWLRQITRHRSREALRTVVRRRRREQVLTEERSQAAPDAAPTPAEALLTAEAMRVLEEVLTAVPRPVAEVLTLYYRSDSSIADVAAQLGIRLDAAKKRLQRGRELIRAELLTRFGEVSARTSPGAALTAAVLAGITAATPGTTVAATAGAGSAVVTGGGLKLASVLGAGAISLAPSLAAIACAYRQLLRKARAPKERRDIVRLALATGAAVSTFVALYLVAQVRRSPSLMAFSFVPWVVVSIVIQHRVLPHAIAGRQALERAEDAGAERRQRRERWWGFFGLYVGLSFGTFAIVWNLLKFLR